MSSPVTDHETALILATEELRRIGESASMLFNTVDMLDATSWNDETAGSSSGQFDFAYAQALQRPSATACAYINETGLRQIRARSRAFASMNPYWMAVRENKIAYAIGAGHTLSVVPRRKSARRQPTDGLIRRVTDEIDQFFRINQYRRRQGEKLTRLDRDGEYFLRFYEDREDGILRVRFVEPILIQNPPGLSEANDVWFGVQFANGDYEEPVRYYIRPATYDGSSNTELESLWRAGVSAKDIQHRTLNVDIGSPRGLPTTYVLAETAMQAVSTLRSMGRLVDIRARIALIRKQVNASLDKIQPLLLQSRAKQMSNNYGQLRNAFSIPYGGIIDTNDQRTYEFPTQHIETDKIVQSLKADLQSIAAAVGLADFTISGDSTQSFANALVKEGPMDRAISRIRQDLIDDDQEVYERALHLAAQHDRLPKNVNKLVKITIMPPGVISRDRLINTQADEILVRNGAMSPATMAMRSNLDPDDERQKAKDNPSPQVAATLNKQQPQAKAGGKPNARGVPSGSEPGPGANPMRKEAD